MFVCLMVIMTEVTWLGHACFFIRTSSISILIDPFLSNPMVGLMLSVFSLDPFQCFGKGFRCGLYSCYSWTW